MNLLLGRNDFFAVSKEVHANQDYKRAHDSLAAFMHHSVDYIEHHSNELTFLGVPLRTVYIKSVIATGALQALTVVISVFKSINS